MLVGIVVPTVEGREGCLEDCLESHAQGGLPCDFAIIENELTCGDAWNKGAKVLERRHGERMTHILFTADDLIATPGYLVSAMTACKDKTLPAPMLWNDTEQGLQMADPRETPGATAVFSRIPFFPIEVYRQLGPVPGEPALHYYSDCWYGDVAIHKGYTFQVVPGFAFMHSWHPAGRMDETRYDDRNRYERFRAQL